jgi:hypothetical protein
MVLLLLAAGAVSLAAGGPHAGTIQCTKGGMGGGDVHAGNYTVAAAAAYCLSDKKCAAFTAEVAIMGRRAIQTPISIFYMDNH